MDFWLPPTTSSVEFSTKRRNMERCPAQRALAGSREGLKGLSTLLISNDCLSDQTKRIAKTAILSRSNQGQIWPGCPPLHSCHLGLGHSLWWGLSLHCRLFSSIPGFYPFKANCTWPQLRQLKMSPFIVTCKNQWVLPLCPGTSLVYSWDPSKGWREG